MKVWPKFCIGTLVWLLSTAVQAEEAPGGAIEAIGGVVRYVELKPTFVTNFGISDNGRLRYLKM